MAYTAYDIGADLVALACNQDGTSLTDLVVVGQNNATATAFVYQNGVTTVLPSLPGSIPYFGETSSAGSISADGTVIGGFCTDSTGRFRAVYWTGSGASWTIHLLTEPAGYEDRFWGRSVYVSWDGLVFSAAYGTAQASSYPAAFFYWSDPATPVPLGMSGEDLEGTSIGSSQTGSVLYAVRGVAPTFYWSYWTNGSGPSDVIEPVWPDNGQTAGSSAYAAANDGSRGVFTAGYFDDFTSEVLRGFYSNDAHTLVLLDLPAGATLSHAYCCDTGCDNIAGHTDVGAVLWVSEVPQILPALSGATANNSYYAFGMNGNASLIVGMGADASAALRGIIWYSPPVPAPPDVPTGQACNFPSVATSITASWSAVSGATSYDVRWRLTSVSGWTTVTGITNLFYTVTGLSMSNAVEWQVRAVNAGGASAWSASTTCQTMPAACFGLCYECGPFEVCAPCDTFSMPEECS